jgi:hypothetical protein
MNRRTLVYWLPTGLFCAVLGFSGFAHFTHLEPMVEAMTKLGYPSYFMTILGCAKLLGVAALLAPGRPLLKEWAYAGFAFNLLGATASHAFTGDPLSEMIRPAMVLVLGAASYLLRPAARRLPSAPALGAGSLPSHSVTTASQG